MQHEDKKIQEQNWRRMLQIDDLTSSFPALKWRQKKHVFLIRVKSISKSNGLYTGETRSMWPQCPGHWNDCCPHDLQGACSSIGPNKGSYNPPGIGLPTLSSKIGFVIFKTLCFLTSSSVMKLNLTPSTISDAPCNNKLVIRGA